MNIREMENKFGAVQFKGRKYILTSQADCTSRLLPDYQRDTHFEMSASAADEEGNEYTVYWIFENDEDLELDQYDYDDVDRVIGR